MRAKNHSKVSFTIPWQDIQNIKLTTKVTVQSFHDLNLHLFCLEPSRRQGAGLKHWTRHFARKPSKREKPQNLKGIAITTKRYLKICLKIESKWDLASDDFIWFIQNFQTFGFLSIFSTLKEQGNKVITPHRGTVGHFLPRAAKQSDSAPTLDWEQLSLRCLWSSE